MLKISEEKAKEWVKRKKEIEEERRECNKNYEESRMNKIQEEEKNFIVKLWKI